MSDEAFAFKTGVATHVGRVRTENEDAYLVSEAAGVWAVADGMGGHQGGSLASTTAVKALASVQRAASAADLLAQCEAAASRANAAILQYAQSDTIGTTLVVLLVHGAGFACVWSGDSRLYLVYGGTIEQLTKDHSEVEELLTAGVISDEQAKTWPRRNVVTRALGVFAEPQLDIIKGDLRQDDCFVLCSDGLTNHVSAAEILTHVSADEPQKAADTLVNLTLQRGATDNVTVVVVRCLRHREPTVLFRGTNPLLGSGSRQ